MDFWRQAAELASVYPLLVLQKMAVNIRDKLTSGFRDWLDFLYLLEVALEGRTLDKTLDNS